MAVDHKGKIALVTGANKGIGFEVAHQLGAEGVTVFLGARNPYLGKSAEEKLRADGVDAFFIELDVTKRESIVRAAEQFGSDYPFITPDRWLADFAQISIRDDVRPLIVKENAVKLLQLNENRA